MPRLPRWIGPCVLALGVLAPGCASAKPHASDGPRFVFQDSFWVNLHHFLRAEARRDGRGAALVLPVESLAADEKSAWRAALAAYGELAQKNLLFDDELVGINVTLAGAGEPRELPRGLLTPELTGALNGAAPVYRAHVWPEQERRNDAWIAATEPLVAEHAAMLTAALASAYGVEWPALPILVDPCSESGPFMAYTTSAAPPGFAGHIVIAPSDANRGPVAFECIAHEASHVVDAALTRMIDDESARQGVAAPPELWHALLFFTSGFVAERVLGEAGTYRTDVTAGYPAYSGALEKEWQPYLERRVTLEEALMQLVRESDLENSARGGERGR